MPPIRSLDFSCLILRDAFDLAVLIEEEARDRYQELAEQMTLHHNEEAASFFTFMVGNEAKHMEVLQKRRVERFGGEAAAVRRSMLFDVEAPDYDDARAFMTVREALETALRAERKAYAFFDSALEQIADAQVQSLFLELRDEEAEHEQLVLDQLARLAPDSPLLAEDLADDPVAQ